MEHLGFSHLRDLWTGKDHGREQSGEPEFAPLIYQFCERHMHHTTHNEPFNLGHTSLKGRRTVSDNSSPKETFLYYCAVSTLQLYYGGSRLGGSNCNGRILFDLVT